MSSGSFIVEDLINEEFSESGWLDQTMQCTSKESVSVPAGDFESYKISYSSDTVWYSSEVGNIVKSEVDHSGTNNSFNMDLSLQSFSRGTQPINISEDIARWALEKRFVNNEMIPNFLHYIETGPLREVDPRRDLPHRNIDTAVHVRDLPFPVFSDVQQLPKFGLALPFHEVCR